MEFFMIIKTFISGALQQNTYLLIDEESKEAIVIDLGGNFKAIKTAVESAGAKLKFVLNTHGHFDHILGEVELQESDLNVPIYMHKDDKFHADNIEASLKRWGLGESCPPVKITEFIDENSDLSIGKYKIKAFHTPGHSKGGMCYLIDGNLFSGDTLFFGSVGRSDFIDGNHQELIESIKTKLMPLPDETKVYTGHGPATTIAYEKAHNSFIR